MSTQPISAPGSGVSEPDPRVSELAVRLAELLSKSSAESLFHLNTALAASELSGVGGTLLIEVPRRAGEHVRTKWAGGSTGLSLPL